MNFVKLYIGDYLRDTGTLTLAQHGAYVLMLLEHYATEKPLPTGRELHRLLRADSKAERDAIDFIAAKFWTSTDDGLINNRAEREIERAAHQREVNQQIGKRGGRPKKTQSETESVSETEPNRNPNHSQTPDIRDTENHSEQRAGDPESGIQGHQPTPAGSVCRAMRQAGLQATNPGDPRFLALLQQGATEAEFVGIAIEAVDKGKGWAWVLAVLLARRSEAAAMHLAPPVAPPSPTVSSRAADDTQRYLAEQAAHQRSAPPPEILARLGRAVKVTQ